MWIDNIKDLYRCYINTNSSEVSKVKIGYILKDCLYNLNYDLFGISYSNFIKEYENERIENLPSNIKIVVINFNKLYKKIITELDSCNSIEESNIYYEFKNTLKELLKFIYSVSKVNDIKGLNKNMNVFPFKYVAYQDIKKIKILN